MCKFLSDSNKEAKCARLWIFQYSANYLLTYLLTYLHGWWVHNLRIAVPTCSEPVPLFGLATGLDEATESDDENSDDETAVAAAAQDTAAVNDDCCEVCLVAERNVCIALLPCGHQRFCESWANEVFRQGRGCPICSAGINMILRLY